MESEQRLHDRINLERLVSALEKTVDKGQPWPYEKSEPYPLPPWITARRNLQVYLGHSNRTAMD